MKQKNAKKTQHKMRMHGVKRMLAVSISENNVINILDFICLISDAQTFEDSLAKTQTLFQLQR